MSFSLHTESPFATPSHRHGHHNPSAGNTPFFESNAFPPTHSSNPFAQQQQQQPGSSTQQSWASGTFATPLQPNRTSNVPAFHYPGQDPFASAFPAAGSSPGAPSFQPKSPFSLQASSPPKPLLQPPAQGQQQRKPKGYRYRAYNRPNENAYQPINSSPLAQPLPPRVVDDDMDDDDDDDDGDAAFDANVHSSPLGRQFPNSSSTVTAGSSSCAQPASAWNFGSAPAGRRRRPRTPGNDDDEEDEDDAVNPSPLFARRRAQYKSTGPSRRSLPHIPLNRRLSHTTPSHPSTSFTSTSLTLFSSPTSPTSSPPIASLFSVRPARTEVEENPRTAFLKERFKKRYFARATKARERAVREGRRRVEGMEGLLDPVYGDDGDEKEKNAKRMGRGREKGKGRCSEDEMESEDEDGEGGLNDPLLGRFMALINRKEQHAYRQSYAREVGSSFDPDMEDVARWEEEFAGPPVWSSRQVFEEGSPGKQRDIGSSPPRAPTEYEFDGDLEEFDGELDEEVEAYAEEYARAVQEQEGFEQNEGQGQRATYEDTLEGLENLPEDELFGEWNWSEEDGMDMS